LELELEWKARSLELVWKELLLELELELEKKLGLELVWKELLLVLELEWKRLGLERVWKELLSGVRHGRIGLFSSQRPDHLLQLGLRVGLLLLEGQELPLLEGQELPLLEEHGRLPALAAQPAYGM